MRGWAAGPGACGVGVHCSAAAAVLVLSHGNGGLAEGSEARRLIAKEGRPSPHVAAATAAAAAAAAVPGASPGAALLSRHWSVMQVLA